MTHRLILPALAAALSIPALTPATFGAPATPTNKVLVIPFTTLNVPADQQWIGKAVQETLIADLGQSQDYSPIAFQGQTVVEDNSTAARLAKDSATPFVVRGAAQMVNGDIRLTAQLIDAKTGDSISTAIATGPATSLLKLEDNIAAQLHAAPAAAGPALAMPATPAPPVPPAAPTAPVAPAVVYSQPTYTQPMVYPPAPYNDISLAAQNYNYYSPDNYPVAVYQPSYYPTYAAPLYSGIYLGYGSYPIYNNCYPRTFIGGSFVARGGIHFRGGIGNGGTVRVGLGSGGFRGGEGFHVGGGFQSGGGFHSGGGGVHVSTGGGFHGGGRR